jgi:hypothetical protein
VCFISCTLTNRIVKYKPLITSRIAYLVRRKRHTRLKIILSVYTNQLHSEPWKIKTQKMAFRYPIPKDQLKQRQREQRQLRKRQMPLYKVIGNKRYYISHEQAYEEERRRIQLRANIEAWHVRAYGPVKEKRSSAIVLLEEPSPSCNPSHSHIV